MSGRIADYLTELERSLKCGHEGKSDILAEVEDHLRAAPEHVRSSGASVEAAERQSVAAFGEPSVLAMRLGRGSPARRALTTAALAIGVLMVAGFGLGLQTPAAAEDTRGGIAIGWAQRSHEAEPPPQMQEPADSTPDAPEVPMPE
jgi:hypothetical protein